MTDPAPVVDVDHLARRLGLPVPVTDPEVAFTLSEAIADRQAVVESYLGIPVTPVEFTESGLWPLMQGWDLANEPVVAITSTVAELNDASLPTGRFTITYTAGLDGANGVQYAPIRRWVLAHAAASVEVRRMLRAVSPATGRVIKSLSAEGQSVSYDDDLAQAGGASVTGQLAAATDGLGLPTLASLDRWRRANRRSYSRPTSW